METGTYNASLQFGNYAYNMSGVTTEQSVTRATTKGESLNSYDDMEFINEQYDGYGMQDVEIIAIDPNSFYSSDVSSVSSDSSEASDGEDNVQEMLATTSHSFNATQFDVQSSDNNFDIITLNIDDEFIDPQNDDILFKNDHQFDLANYISGENTSLLLSPVNDTISSRRRLENYSELISPPKIPIIAAHDNKGPKIPANSKRKRKNLSREFIESSDSETDNEKNAATNSINYDLDCSKRNKLVKTRKDDDPVWDPSADNKGKVKKPVGGRAKKTIDSNVCKEENKNAKAGLSIQGNSLRNMLKQQMLSDRPTNKTKLFKTITSNEKVSSAKPVAPPIAAKRIGIGRGNDIQITAKYYNCNETSDNDDRDKSVKKDRYHQIYTDSDDSEDMNTEFNYKPPSPSKVYTEEKLILAGETSESNSDVDVCCKEEFVSNEEPVVVQKKTYFRQVEEKPINEHNKSVVKSKTSVNKKQIHLDSNSIDSTDFAKALATNPTPKVKTKPSASLAAKKNSLEQQKRHLQSTLLLQNPAKFKIFSVDKCREPTIKNVSVKKALSISQDRSSDLSVVKPEPAKIVFESPEKRNEAIISHQNIKSETDKKDVDVQDVMDDMKLDVMTAEEIKTESCVKRKLNLQEYFERKSLKGCVNTRPITAYDMQVNAKIEESKDKNPVDSNKGDNEQTNEESSSIKFGNSMYEEVITVSMGCNTDVSIPIFTQQTHLKDIKSVKSTELLSDIQTTVEKANSKISSCSLISSIQDLILKKSHSIEQECKNGSVNGDGDTVDGEESKEVAEHGENKTIMHLRKDRVRPLRSTISIQTDPYFQFPPLEKLTPLSKEQFSMTEKRNSLPRDMRSNESRYSHVDGQARVQRNYRRHSNHLSESSYYTDDEEKTIPRRSRHSDFMERNKERKRTRTESSRYSSSKYDRYLSRHRTISRSLSSSSDNSTTSTDSSTSSQSSSSSDTYVSSASARSLNSYGGSSAKSHYGDDHQYYRKRNSSNTSHRSNYRPSSSIRSKSPEERRIIYVGRLEETITKDELRRKFSVYGRVKQVSIHYKETKMIYGFVTYVRPCDAYTAIDDTKRNSSICHYDISFGGRRAFCRENYFDLDNTRVNNSCSTTICQEVKEPNKPIDENSDSFDVLLHKMMKEKQKKQSHSKS